jgi:protein CpxP
MTISLRRFQINRNTIVAFVAGAALVGGFGVLARAEAVGGWHHALGGGGAHSAADMTAHVDRVLAHFYIEIQATDAQQAQIDPLVKQAVNDLLPMHAQLQNAHAQLMQALAQPTIDRGALESARLQHLQLADEASKRIVQLIADVGDVLTPAQRQALADHLAHMRGMPHS